MNRSFFPRFAIFLLLGGVSVSTSPAHADHAYLKSGDRISGKLVRFEENQLIFQTDIAGTARLARKDLVAIASDRTVTVVFTNGARRTGRLVVGKLGQMLIVQAVPDAFVFFPLDQVQAIYPGAKLPKSFRWGGKIDVGLTFERGNTDKDNLFLKLETTGRSKAERLRIEGEGEFETERDTTTTQEASGIAEHHRFSGKRLFFFTALFAEYDKFKSLSLRSLLATGPGYQFVEDDVQNLEGRVGPGWLHQDFRDSATSDDPALTVALRYDRRFFNKRVKIFTRPNLIWNLGNTDSVIFKLRSGVDFPVIWGFTTSLTWDLDYESEPQPGRDTSDNTIRASIGYEW